MRLVDCFIETLAYSRLFLRKPQGDYDAFRAKVELMIGDALKQARELGVADDDVQNALFAVVAWLDEAVLTSGWEYTELWKRSQLQKVHFATTRGGVEFFTRLDALPAHQKAVREVYYFCIMLGFKGQYVYRKDKKSLETLRHQTLDLLLEGANLPQLTERTVLFPAAYPAPEPEAVVQKRRFKVTAALLGLIATPVLVLLLFYGTFQFILHYQVSDAEKFLIPADKAPSAQAAQPPVAR